MIDVDLIIRVMLNTASAVFFLLAYRKLRFFGFILLSAQVALNLLTRLSIIFFGLSASEPLYCILLILSNVISLLAAIYLYKSVTDLEGET